MAEYIERGRLKEAISADCQHLFSFDASFYDMVMIDIDEVPAADVAPVVHSRWEQCDYVEPCIHGFGTNRIKNAGMKCLNCVHVFKRDLLWTSNFCPNCGAKMDLED